MKKEPGKSLGSFLSPHNVPFERVDEIGRAVEDAVRNPTAGVAELNLPVAAHIDLDWHRNKDQNLGPDPLKLIAVGHVKMEQMQGKEFINVRAGNRSILPEMQRGMPPQTGDHAAIILFVVFLQRNIHIGDREEKRDETFFHSCELIAVFFAEFPQTPEEPAPLMHGAQKFDQIPEQNHANQERDQHLRIRYFQNLEERVNRSNGDRRNRADDLAE